jgi:hypothetical protein
MQSCRETETPLRRGGIGARLADQTTGLAINVKRGRLMSR